MSRLMEIYKILSKMVKGPYKEDIIQDCIVYILEKKLLNKKGLNLKLLTKKFSKKYRYPEYSLNETRLIKK